MASIQFTPADRDERGFIKVPTAEEPRSLADLLPTPESIKQDAARPVRQRLSRQELALIFAVALLAAFVIAYAWTTPTAAPTPQIERATIMPPTVPPARPTAAPTAVVPVRMLGAYAAPDGALLGEIEETRAITPVAHYEADWVQANVQGSGLIWIRAADMPGLALTGPDLAPKAAPMDERPPVAWNPPAHAVEAAPVEVAPTLPPTSLAAFQSAPNGQKATNSGDWCRGAHLDDQECQESRDAGHGQKAAQP